VGEQIISIGRTPVCTIVLADPNVSRNHAEIRPQGRGFIVVDLGSTNGSRVNGVRVREQMLVDGDELAFGNTRMRFEAS
jgi:pSer/pThr/pTyr-binding forkhead associated (FHA) protein